MKDPKSTPKRGFAAMSPERLKEIAQRGGASVPGVKRAFSRDKTLAISAGRKGGMSKTERGSSAGVDRSGPKPRHHDDDT